MDSSPLSLKQNSRSLNSVGSSGSIWQNHSDSSFAQLDTAGYGFYDGGPPTSGSQSLIDDAPWEGGLTLAARETEFPPFSAVPEELGMIGRYDRSEESRLPVFRHLSKHDTESV